MNYAFPEIDPNTAGTIRNVPVPLGRYLSESFAAGEHDTVLNSLNRISEFSTADDDIDSPMLDTETANKKWAIGNLKFTEPVRESVARVMNQRKRDEMDREFFLNQGSSMGRFLPGMAASMLGAVSNPLDLGLMFIPFVGEEAAAAKATTMFGRMAARRLVTREALQAAFPAAPRLTEAVINGMVGQTLFEIPNIVASAQDQANYGPKQAAFNIFTGGAFAAAMHGLGVVMQRLGRGTREEMARQALNQMLRDETVKVHQYVNVDEAAILEKLKFDADAAMKQAQAFVDYDVLAKTIHDKSGLKVNPDTPAAFITPDGKHEIDSTHWTEKMVKFLDENPDAVRAYHLTDGRIVGESAMAEKLGVPAEDLTSEYFTFESETGLTKAEDAYLKQELDNGRDRKAVIQEIIEQRDERARTNFFKDPAEREKLNNAYKKAIDDFIEAERLKHEQTKKSRFDEMKQAEIERQIAEGKILKPEDVQKNIPPEKFDGSTDSDLDFDIQGLKQDLKLDEAGVKPDNSGTVESNIVEQTISGIDKLIKSLDHDPTKMSLPLADLLTLGLGRPILKGLLMAVKEGLVLFNDLTKAIDYAMKWLAKQQGGSKNHEQLVRKHLEDAISEEIKNQPMEIKPLPKEGDRILLPAIEDQPETMARVLGVDFFGTEHMLTVEVEPEYRSGPGDDGLRELSYDQYAGVERTGETQLSPPKPQIEAIESAVDCILRKLA